MGPGNLLLNEFAGNADIADQSHTLRTTGLQNQYAIEYFEVIERYTISVVQYSSH